MQGQAERGKVGDKPRGGCSEMTNNCISDSIVEISISPKQVNRRLIIQDMENRSAQLYALLLGSTEVLPQALRCG